MKKLLLLTFIALGQYIYAQNIAANCGDAYSLCGALGEPFANTINQPQADSLSVASYGCLVTTPNPAWFYMPISQSGSLSFVISQVSTQGAGIDVDYICWGPFNTLDSICGPENLNDSTLVSCSYSPVATESFTLPNAIEGTYYIILVTNYSNQPGDITVIHTGGGTGESGGALNCSGINLNAFIDANANGTQDPGELGFPFGNFIYEANNDGNVHNVTAFNGDYTIYDQNLANIYDISYEIPAQYAAYYSLATASYENVAVEQANNIITYNFPITITQLYQDLSVTIIAGNSPPVAGFSYLTYIAYTNTGNQVIPAGIVSFTNTPNFEITNLASLAPNATVTPTGFDYAFTNLQPFETRYISVYIQIPAIPEVTLGDEVTSTVTITPIDNDADPSNNTSSIMQVIVGSYDPNDITESRGREIEINTFDDADYLYYTIRFQNTGTYHARNAKIEDLLGTQFDYSTVQVIRASHDFTMDRQNNHLTWTFNNIYLPASQDNEAGSHGYIYFRVKPLPGYAVGDIIPNSADIYFDFNPAIVTNTFETEFVAEALGVKDITDKSFMLYPNPAKNTVHITTATDGIASIKIYDLTGKTIYNAKSANVASLTIDSAAFASGTYFVEVLSSTNAKTVKKLLIQ